MSNRRRTRSADADAYRTIARRWERRAKAKDRKLADARRTITSLTDKLDAIANELDDLTDRLNRTEP